MARTRVPTLETERLILRRWKRKDAEDLFEYGCNPNVGPSAGWRPYENVYEARFAISNSFIGFMVWAIADRETGKVIGSIALNDDSFRPDIKSKEMGYSLSEDYWGRGLMTEAAMKIMEYAFNKLHLAVLMIKTSTDNIRSQRVIEKCGFKYEGTLRKSYRMYDGTVKTVQCYSLLKEEYEAAGKADEGHGQKER